MESNGNGKGKGYPVKGKGKKKGKASPGGPGPSTRLFAFPTREIPGIPGQPASTVVLKSHELTNEVLRNLWMFYMIDNHRSQFAALWIPRGWTWVVAWEVDDSTIQVQLHSGSEQAEAALSYPSGEISTDSSLVHDVQAAVSDVIRAVALTRFGPEQQFEPTELFGIKRYLAAHNSGGGARFSKPCIVSIEEAEYAVWYNPAHGAVILQELVQFNQSTQLHKIGVSFRTVSAGLEIDQIRQENQPVPRISEEYMRIFDRIANIVAFAERERNGIHRNVITCELCWLFRNIDKVFGLVTQYAQSGADTIFKSAFTPDELQRIMFSEDAMDAGGLGRQFVTLLMQRVTDTRCQLVQREGNHFAAKSPEGLDLREEKVYTGLGSMIAILLKSKGEQAAMGEIFPLMVYRIIFAHWIMSADANIQIARMLVDSEGTQPLREVLKLLDQPVAAVRSITDMMMQYTIFECIQYMDEGLFPDGMPPDDWAGFWSSEDIWLRACKAIDQQFVEQYQSRILPLLAVARGFRASFATWSAAQQQIGIYSNQKVHLWRRWYKNDHMAYRLYTDASETISAEFPTLTEDQAAVAQVALVKYHCTGEESTVTSATSGDGQPWTHGRVVVNAEGVQYLRLGTAKVFHVGFASKASRDREIDAVFGAVRNQVQGRLSRDALVGRMTVAESLPNVRTWLSKWIREGDQDLLERFIEFVSGSTRLLPSQHINITESHDSRFHSHTCFIRLDVPRLIERGTEDTFLRSLEALL